MKKEISVSLDMQMTGKVLSDMIRKRGYTIAEIQRELKLSCPQPIYRWMNGQTMPSIDNLYKLSTILNVHMEDLVIPRQDEVWILHRNQNLAKCIRLKKYHETYRKICQEKNQKPKKAG
ncbi:MAG: helix-turn-helix domain-containing protein [Lachnospiraceae bacterium]|nr:helix-turn-helix domain-containing protein [Lachnospiraceae bacterium]